MINQPTAPRVVLLTGEYPPTPGGLGDYTARLAAHLHEQGQSVLVLTSHGPIGDEPFEVRRTLTTWGRKLRSQVNTVLQEWQADILHIQYQTGAYLMRPAINLLPSRLQTPVVVTFHDLRMPYLAPKMVPLRRYVTRLLLEGSRRVVVTNIEDQARLQGSAPPTADPDIYTLTRPLQPPPVLIPIGANIAVETNVDRAAIRRELGIATGETVIAYFGIFNRSKGVDTLIAALGELPPVFRLLIIGGTANTPPDEQYAAEVEAQIAAADLGKRIIRTGYVPAERASALLQAADMAALPFTDGAMYRRGSLLAILAHGLPLVTTTPPMRLDPTLRDGHNVLLIEPHSPAQLADSLQRLHHDAELRQALATNAPHIAEAFTWPTIARRHRALYNEICTQ